MKTIQELYGNDSYWGSYKELVRGFEYALLLWEDDNDYQGDSRVLVFDEVSDRFGFLNFGWGSCSGCDVLQACSTLDELEALYYEMHDRIVWFDNANALYAFFSKHDWEGDYSVSESFNDKVLTLAASIYHHSQGQTIRQEVIDILQAWEKDANS